MNRRLPFRIDAYCGCCHTETVQYVKEEHCDSSRSCFECVRCHHLAFSTRGKEPGVRWYDTSRRKKPLIASERTASAQAKTE